MNKEHKAINSALHEAQEKVQAARILSRPRCKDCKHMWPPYPGQSLPSCHRRAPVLLAQAVPAPVKRDVMAPTEPPQMQLQWMQLGGWPPTDESLGCSEWEKDESVASEAANA